MNHLAFSALAPVVLLVALGYVAGRLRWLRAESAKDLSNLVFLVLTPALMFRTMGKVDVRHLDATPLLSYFAALLLLFGGVLLWQGLNRRAAVLALSATFGNLVMIGIAFVGLAYGEQGLVILLSLVSIHALVLLSVATVALEFAVAREKARAEAPDATGRVRLGGLLRMVLGAVRNTLIHPVPLPIIAGLLYGQTGWGIPAVIDQPLQWLGAAMGPLALLLVGVSLSGASIGSHLRGAVSLSLLKLLLLPVLVVGIAWFCGISGLPLTIMAVAASLPMGANVFLFSQRYEVAQDLVTASIAVSTALALLTVPLVMAVAARLG